MISGKSSGQTIIRKIIALSGLLIVVIVVNAIYSTFHESRNLSRQISAHLNNKLEIALSVQDNEIDKLRMISVSIKEQSRKFADFLDYDDIVPITMMLKNIIYLYPGDIDFIFLFDEYGEFLTSNISGTDIGQPDIYSSMISDDRERVSIEEMSPDIFQGPFAKFLPLPDQGRIICFKSLLHILHDSGDIYCYVVVIKLISGNGKLIRKMAGKSGAGVVYYNREGHPVLTDFPDLSVPHPDKNTIAYQGKTFFTEWKGIPDYAGQSVGKLLVAIDRQPFSDAGKRRLLNRLLPFFASTGISIVLLLLLKGRVFDKICQLIAVQRMVAEGKGDLSVRMRLPERTASHRLDEVEQMGADFNLMMDKLEETHSQLVTALADVRDANRYIMESLEYAKGIQNSMLPNLDEVRDFLPDSFVIWMPRDVVSGDIFLMEPLAEGFAVAVIDCTGHGVPGAFLTMIASSGLKKIIREDECRKPAQMLKSLNIVVKTTLHQDTGYAAVSDDGMDMGLCVVNTNENILTFSGARISLFYSENGRINIIRGDRQSIGYKQSRRADIRFDFTNHAVSVEKEMCFYMASDGFEDQMGPDEERQHQIRCFGRKRFLSLLEKNCTLPLAEQREKLLEAFDAYRGNHKRPDDVTVVGFRV